MADVKISALSASGALDGSEIVPIVQGGVTVRTTVQDIADLAQGGVTSVNGDTGPIVIAADGATIPGTANKLVYIDTGGFLNTIGGATIDPSTFGFNYYSTADVQDDGYHNWNSWGLNLNPTIASPSATWVNTSFQVYVDPNLTGLPIGVGGLASRMLDLYFQHDGKSSTGSFNYMDMGGHLGNGTDAITVQGFSATQCFLEVRANVTLDGTCSGWTFQPNVLAGSLSTSNLNVTAFGDFSNFHCEVFGYNSVNVAPTIDAIANNHAFQGVVVAPNISAFNGNAGFTAFGVFGTYDGLSATGGWNGIQINPHIISLNAGSTGLNIDPVIDGGTANFTYVNFSHNNNLTSGQVTGLSINFPSNLSTTAVSVQGHVNMSSNFELVSGQGQMYGNVIGGQIIMPDNVAITGTDTLANNFAFGVHTGTASSTWTTASPVGLSCVGFVGFMDGEGTLNGAVNFCLGGFADSRSGGHIDQVNNFYAIAIPQGVGTVGEHILFHGDMPIGLLAGSTCWGVRIDDSASAGIENYVNRFAIGTADKKVTSGYLFEVFGAALATNLHLRAGTTTVAPLKLAPGVLLTTPEDGAFEYDGTHLYFTIGSTRTLIA